MATILLLIFYADKLLQYDITSRGIDLPDNGAEHIKLINEYRKTTIQLIGGIVIAIGLYLTWRRIRAMEKTVFVAEEGQITDRFSKAVEQLGNKESLAVRLGGIYALERIAKDSRNDHWTVMEVLSAFVRNYKPDSNEQAKEKTVDQKENNEGLRKKIPTDIQACLTIIGRRTILFDPENSHIELTGAHLEGADLTETHLEGADLTIANLEEADLTEANLEGADLTEANLEGADLTEANLKGADFLEAHLERANLTEANLEGAYLFKSNLEGANLTEANLKGADLPEANLKGAYLFKSNLEGANLTEVNLKGADLTEANLKGAKT